MALKKIKKSPQDEKEIEEACLSQDAQRIIVVFKNGEGCKLVRKNLDFDDRSPITQIEIFDHGCAIGVHQSSGNYYDLPWDSIRHYAKAGKKKVLKIGKIISAMRKKSQISQEQLAWKTGLSRVQIARIETNASFPSLTTLEKIAAIFNMSLADLVAG